MRRMAGFGVVVLILAGAAWYVARTYVVVGPPPREDAQEGEDLAAPGLRGKGRSKGAEPEAAPVDAQKLFEDLSSEDAKVQLAAYDVAKKAERIPFDEDLAKLMVAWLHSHDRVLVHRAHVVLVRMGPQVLPFTEPLLSGESDAARWYALTLFRDWKLAGFEGVVYPPLLPFLEDRNDLVRQVATALVTSGIPYDEAIANHFKDRMRPGPGQGYYGAEIALASMGDEGFAYVLSLLDDPQLLYNGLGGLRGAPEAQLRKVFPRLKAFIEDDSDEYAQIAAVDLLFRLEGDFEEMLPVLEAALSDESYMLRNQVLMALEQMEDRAAPAVDGLLVALADSDERIAARAASILGDLGVEPEKVLPALRAALVGDAADTAAHALGQYGTAALPYLQDALDRGDDDERYFALYGIAVLGPQAEPLRERVIALMDVDDFELQQRAAATLGRLGAAGAPGIPALLRLRHDDTLTPGAVAAALRDIGAAAEPELSAALRAGSEADRHRVIEVMAEFNGRTAFALDLLAPYLRHIDATVRLHAATAVCAAWWPKKLRTNAHTGDVKLWRRVRDLIRPLRTDADADVRDVVERNLLELEPLTR